jgi:hypothetical protein
MLQGGCYCGTIRYETTGEPFNETTCHCSICRRTTGGTMVSWFSVRRDAFRWITGQPARFQSTPHGTRSFCPRCGAQLIFEDERYPDELDVTTVSLQDPDAVPPSDHTHTGTRLRFVRVADGLPEYPEARSARDV